jgi:hypothetical protein
MENGEINEELKSEWRIKNKKYGMKNEFCGVYIQGMGCIAR